MTSSPARGLDRELESFRQEWLTDLRTRKGDAHELAGTSVAAPFIGPDAAAAPAPGRRLEDVSAGEPEEPPEGLLPRPPRELVSALDHYEEAMEQEARGKMGDSLKLYRQAYRLDHRVERRYREKHFPAGVAQAAKAQTTLEHAEPSQQDGMLAPSKFSDDDGGPRTLPTADLIASFSRLSIQPAPPQIEDTPAPPCPIASIPSELLHLVLTELAISDPGAFAASALICKRFAYLVATEQRIWRRVALSHAFGFAAMHYHFGRAVDWCPLEDGGDDVARPGELDPSLPNGSGQALQHEEDSARTSERLLPSAYPTWQDMFRSRPRIRFHGCYISTVNYIRSGQMSTNQATWGGSPVHIVTYYRYLRFFRGGTCISLLTTTEPAEVVRLLTRDSLLQARGRATHPQHPRLAPSTSPTRLALKGRWHLLSPAGDDLVIETEGVGPKYVYRMDLSLRNASRAATSARNNKLVWRAFHSYNRLTDDWAEFGLKHDKPFFFSRVKSYGWGE